MLVCPSMAIDWWLIQPNGYCLPLNRRIDSRSPVSLATAKNAARLIKACAEEDTKSVASCLCLPCWCDRPRTWKEVKLFCSAKTICAVKHSDAPAVGCASLKGSLMAASIMHSEAKSDMSALCRNLRSFYVYSYLLSVIPCDINHLAACCGDIKCLHWTCEYNSPI